MSAQDTSYAFEYQRTVPLLAGALTQTVWVSRRNENGEICVWRTETAAKRAFDAGSHGLYWKKTVQE